MVNFYFITHNDTQIYVVFYILLYLGLFLFYQLKKEYDNLHSEYNIYNFSFVLFVVDSLFYNL